MRIRAYIVDDEPLAVQRLRTLLDETGRVEVVGSTSAPEEAIEELSRREVDLCFLDIEMPRRNGFQVLAALSRQPFVVFTTAYDRYALQAFEVNSVDYLLKPIERSHLARALDKAERRGVAEPEVQKALQTLLTSLRPLTAAYPERIGSRLGDRICFLDLPRVTHFFAEDKLTYAAADGKRYSVDRSIQSLENTLDPKHFVRIHRGTIVNVGWIKEVGALPGGSLSVRLRDDGKTELSVARDRASEFKQRVGI